jgi:transposase InsO family protein
MEWYRKVNPVNKAEVARHPALTLVGQQRRSTKWLQQYNQDRPHEALGMAVPAKY